MKRLLLLAGAFVLVNPVASQTPPPRVKNQTCASGGCGSGAI